MFSPLRCFALSAAVAVSAALSPVVSLAQAQDKIPVKSLDDLPRHTYQISGSASELLNSDEQIADLISAVRRDVLDELDKYDIKDATTLKSLYSVLLSIDMLNGDYDDALVYLDKVRDLEEKESAKLLTGLTTRAIITAQRQTDGKGEEYHRVFREELAKQLNALPWDVVGDDVQSRLAQVQIFGKNLITGIVKSRLDPIIATLNGKLSADLAQNLISLYYTLNVQLPLKDDLVQVYRETVDAHKEVKNDIWKDREVTLPDDGNYTPVNVCIWDSGVDIALYPHQLWTNTAERPDGTDTDGNGFVDDIHGIAYDLHSNHVQGLLHPLNDLNNDLATVTKYSKGFSDLQAAVNSPEAAEVRKVISELDPAEVQPFIEDMSIFGSFAHGTHVAGIASRGNPFIRMMVSRLSFGYKMLPEAPTVAGAYKDAGAAYEVIDYFRKNGVRVVNMSWGGNRAGIESALEANGIGETAEERAALARKIFKIGRDALYDAMAEASDILFVTSAGNSDNDVEFDEMIPSGFDLPNLLVVGAVDQAGEPTSFTSFGRTVDVYANGFEVESYIPGGKIMKMSGTSMSSPNVVNLAAKILAVRPELTPTQVIDYIIKGSDKSGEKDLRLINPRRTMELLKQN